MSTWPARRWVTAVVAAPLIAAALAAFGWNAGPSLPLISLTLAAAAVGGLIVASYVPVTGRGIDVGCGACAVMSGFTVIGGMVAMSTYAGSLVGPAGAGILMLFGLTRRLNQPTTCAAPTRGTTTPVEHDSFSGLGDR